MTYYPTMAYRMANLEGRLSPPTGLGGILDSFTSWFTSGSTPPMTSTASNVGWCSTSNPQGSCKPINGVCLPTNSQMLAVFKDLQRQCNRMLQKEGRPLLAVDGRIGPSTVNAVAESLKYADTAASSMGLSWANLKGKPCDLIAAHASALTAKIRAFADQYNTPMVADPVTSKPSQPTTAGGVAHPPPDVIAQSASTGLFGFIPATVRTPLGVAALVVGGLLVRKAVMTKGKGSGRRTTKRRARPQRRRRSSRRRR